MAEFRKKPIVVEAVQFDGSNDPPGVYRLRENRKPYVVTIHQQQCFVEPGDWIIAEPGGFHHYPCKPDIFAATYDPV